MAIPLLEACTIAGRDITADALLTQHALADYLIARGAHYHFTVKDNQQTLARDIRRLFEQRGEPDYAEPTAIAHGRIETRRIGCSTALNRYLDFPHVGQVFLVERESIEKKTGERSCDFAIGVTSRTPHPCPPSRLLAINRGHWRIESVHHIIDWNDDEDRNRIRTGQGPANVTRLRRFAIGVLKSVQKPNQSIAEMMRQLARQPRQMLDYLKLTANSAGGARIAP